MYKILLVLLFILPSIADAQVVGRVTQKSQHPYRHAPDDLNVTGSAATDTQVVSYDSATGLFKWKTSGGTVSSGTINQVAKYAATGSVVSGSSILFDDTTNVGIGTAVPLSLLDVNRKFNVLSGGNVGIGTTGPSSLLDVYGTGEVLRVSDSSTTGSPQIGFYQTTSQRAYLQYSNASGLRADSDGEIVFAANNTPAIVIQTDSDVIISPGNVGIGTTLPSSLLEVGAQKFNVLSGGNVGIGTTTPQGAFVVTNGNVGIGTWAPSAALTVNGNVGIGTNSSNALQILLPDGTNVIPSIGFTDATNTGLYHTTPTAGLSIVQGGAISAQFLSTGVTVAGLGIQNSTDSRVGGFAMTTGSIAWGPNTTMDVNISRTAANVITVGTGADQSTGGILVAGNVGIGTTMTSATAKLSVIGGNVGIGTITAPTALYTVGTGYFTTGLNIGIGTASATRLCIANNAVTTCP